MKVVAQDLKSGRVVRVFCSSNGNLWRF